MNVYEMRGWTKPQIENKIAKLLSDYMRLSTHTDTHWETHSQHAETLSRQNNK